MGQAIRYPERHDRRVKKSALFIHVGDRTVPFKCDPDQHAWRLNARIGDRCFCGQQRKADR